MTSRVIAKRLGDLPTYGLGYNTGALLYSEDGSNYQIPMTNFLTASKSFDVGFTITSIKEEIVYGGQRLVWTGTYPKTVPSGSTPDTTGGIGSGAWAYSNDSVLRENLRSNDVGFGANLIGMPDGVVGDYIKYKTYESLGAKFDGITDDTAAIQAGNNLTLLGYTVVAETPNGRARITSPVIFYAAAGNVDMKTAYLKPDSSAMTSGYAARVMGNPNTVYNKGSNLKINMMGPYGEQGTTVPKDTSTITTSLCGLQIYPGDSTQVSNVNFYLKIYGFKNNIYVGPKSVYLLRFYSPDVGRSWDKNWIFDCQNDAGENISFFGGCGFNCQNSSGTGTDIYVTPEGQYLDLHLFGYSQDYNDIQLYMKGGIITKHGGQFEDNSISPYVIMEYQPGKRKPMVCLTSIKIDGGNDAAQAAGNLGKPSWFKIGNGCSFIANGGSWGKYAKMQKIKLFDATAGGPIQITLKNIFFDMQSNVDYLEWGAAGNLLRNYDFSLGNLNYWSATYSSDGVITQPTISYDSTITSLGNAVKIVGTAGGNTTTLYGQKIPVEPGKLLIASTMLYWQNINTTNGTTYFSYVFYDINGVEISHGNIGPNLNTQPTSAAAPLICSNSIRVPEGCFTAFVGLRHYQMGGTVWMGKVNVLVQ